MRHPDFVPIYYRELKRLVETTFSAEQLNPLLDRLLGDFVPEQTITAMKNFAASRNAYVLSQIPLNLTVSTSLPVVNGFPRTTNAIVALNGFGNAIDTRFIRVNGTQANWVGWLGTWNANVTLRPGINRVLVQSLDPGGTELARTTIDLWYDDGTVQAANGTIAANTTWTAAGGPYDVTANVTIANGATLTIEAGATVYLGAGVNLTVANGGRLLAEGTDTQRIRFTRAPGSAGNWGGITVNGGADSPETRIAYAHFDLNGNTAVHTVDGTVFLDHLTFGNRAVQYVSLDRSSFVVQECVFPSATSQFELVHGTGGIKAGGRGIFTRNFFGRPTGYNDVVDFTGGNRPGPIVQFINNVFIGSDDDILDLDSTDAWVEGNIFLHAHRNGSPDSSSAVSGGADNADTSQVTIIGNIIYDCDQAALAKQGNFFTLINNTIVHQNHSGGQDTDGAVVICADEGTEEGAGFYLEGNIIYDAEKLVRNQTTALVTFTNNLMPFTWSGPGGNNSSNDPLFKRVPLLSETTNFNSWADAQVLRDWFSLLPGSPATSTGPNGRDKGGVIPLGASISGEPVGTNNQNTATLQVGIGRTGNGMPVAGWPDGSGYTHYRWRLENGPWSGVTPISSPIVLNNLANGLHYVEVSGRRDSGFDQDDPAFGRDALISRSRVWRVDTNYIPPLGGALRINEVLARNDTTLLIGGEYPDLVELFNSGAATIDLSGMGLSDEATNRFKFVFPPGTTLGGGQYLVLYADSENGPGLHLGFNLNQTGESLYLTRVGGQLLDSVTFGLQVADRSIGRMADGGWALTVPTFGAANVLQPLGDIRNVKINEWLADEQTLFFDDFVELYNASDLPINLSGMFLSDAPQGAPDLSRIPSLSFIAARGFVAFTADAEPGDGHVGFKLTPEQGQIGLFAPDLTLIDCILYGPQTTDVSGGRKPSGSATFAFFTQPTPGSANPGEGTTVNVTNLTINLLPLTALWKYEASGTDLGTSWQASNFDDSAWLTGPALLYNENNGSIPNRNTFIPFTSPPQATFYFRTKFLVSTNLSNFTLRASVYLDDGAVLYLNGTELFRIRMANGPVNYSTTATNTPLGGDAFLETFTLPIAALVSGTNVLAVEVHQQSPTSGDMVWGLALAAIRPVTNITSVAPLLNEVMANNRSFTNADGSITDWVELYNPLPGAFDFSGTSLSDDPGLPRRWVFPSGVSLASGAYLVVRFDGTAPPSTNAGPVLNTGFGLKASGDEVYFFDAPVRGGALLDSITFGLQTADFSIGRLANANSWTLDLPTPGSVNIAAGLGSAANLKINEWLANPPPGQDDWFEIFNPNNQPVALGGLHLTDDLSDLRKFEIPPLSFISRNTNGFAQYFADGNPQNGRDHVGFRLSATREAIGIATADGVLIDGVRFELQEEDVSEGRLPDGSPTIVRFRTTKTPAESNYLPLNDVVINEALSHSEAPLEDAIELHNLSAESISVGGWYVSDSNEALRKFRIPDTTVIPGNGFVVIYENQFNPEPGFFPSFALSSVNGDQIYLSAADALGNLTGYRAVARFGAAENGVSFGRYETSVGVDFTAMSQRTFGEDNPGTVEQFRGGPGLPNAYPKVGPIVINEIMYHPADIGPDDNTLGEFIELRNISGTNVSLFHASRPTNTWRLRDAVDFEFATNTTIPAGGYLLVVSFDPATNGPALAAFNATYGLAPGIAMVGPYRGKLDNSGESVELTKPDESQPGPAVPYVLEDKVRYHDSAPWPIAADTATNSISLQRRNSSAYGNDPVNWLAGTPTPGAANGFGVITPPAITLQPASQLVLPGATVTFFAAASGDALLEYQWRFRGSDIVGANSSSLTLSNVQPADAGNYTLRVSNPAGAAISDAATLTLRLPPSITRQPQDKIAAVGGTAVFSVAAGGTLPLTYQWRFNGTNLGGATAHSLTIANVQLANVGAYSALITNNYGSVTSELAQLTIADLPAITDQPDSQTVLAGSTVSFSVAITGTPPLTYQWTFNGNVLPGENGAALVLPNVQPSNSGDYRVIVSNAVGRAISDIATLTVVTPPTLTITATDANAAEAGLNPGLFTIARTGSTNFALTINLSVSGGAANGIDYATITTPINMPAGVATVTIPVSPVDDLTREGSETVVIGLNNGTGYLVGSPASATVVIVDNDNLAPTVSIISPTNNSLYFITPTNIPITVSASDPDGTVQKVEFFNYGTNRLGESAVAPFSFTWTNVTVGTNILTAVATDDLGTPATSVPIVFYVNVPPTVTISSPANGTVFPPGTNITITATAGDSDGTIVRVEFFSDNTSIGIDVSSPYGVTLTNVDIGTYTLRAKATDNRGMSSLSSPVTVRVKVPTSDFADMFEDRGTIAGYGHTITGNSSGATREPGEPPAYASGTRTVWLRWVAPANGSCVMDTFGSSFDTVLAVFTNDPPSVQSISNLALVAENDDFNGLTSQVSFNVSEGTTYQIRVEGFGSSAGGDIVFHLGLISEAPRIFVQPENQTVLPGGRAAFSVVAAATTAFTTQWRFNGTDIPGATSSSLIISNVQAVNLGEYTVMVSNRFGFEISRPAILSFGTRPVMTMQPQPQSQTAVEGDTISFAVSASGSLPMTFRWRRNNQFLTNAAYILNTNTSVFTISNVQTNDAGSYSVVITNFLGTIISQTAQLIVLADRDHDHTPDVWEIANRLDPDDARDAALDSDQDGVSNLDEYRSGTDPQDPSSRLEIISIGAVAGLVTLQFPAVSNKTYSVLYRASPAGGGAWLSLSNIATAATNRTINVTDSSPGGGRYYRLRTPQLP